MSEDLDNLSDLYLPIMDLIYLILIYLSVGIFLTFIFMTLMRFNIFPHVFRPKEICEAEYIPFSSKRNLKEKKQLISLKKSFISWIIYSIKIPYKQFFELNGLDSTIFVLILEFFFILSSVSLFCILCSYSPLLAKFIKTDYTILSFTTLPYIKSFAAPYLFTYVYVISIIAMILLMRLNNKVRYFIREHYLKNQIYSYSLMIVNKNNLFDNFYELKKLIQTKYEDNISNIYTCKDINKLDKTYKKYVYHINIYNLLYNTDKYKIRYDLNLTNNDFSNKYETKYENNIDIYYNKLCKFRNDYMFNDSEIMFFVLNSKETVDEILDSDEFYVYKTSCSIERCPDPSDMIWKSFGMPYAVRIAKKIIEIILFILFILFWSIPITFLTLLVNEEFLEKITNYINHTFTKNSITIFLDNFLSTLIFFLFVLMIPVILKILIKLTYPLTYSMSEIKMMNRYYISLLAVLLFKTASQIASNFIFTSNDFHKAMKEFVRSIERNSSFFLSYVAMATLLKPSIELLRVFSLITDVPILKLTADVFPYRFYYGLYYSLHLFTFTIIIVYSTVFPLIFILSPFYFGIYYYISIYQHTYVFYPKGQSNGKYFTSVILIMFIIFLLFQFITINILFFYKHQIYALCILPIFLLTLIKCIHEYYKNKNYLKEIQSLAGNKLIHLPESWRNMYLTPAIYDDLEKNNGKRG